ncbi:MAG: penicillin-binding protein 2 [Actinomycetota bacterium]|nr:penicillin-binding protein 2 [Actinomycetota bacterium]
MMTTSRGGESAPLRLGVLGIVVVSLFAALLARLWYLQVMDSQTFQVEAKTNQVRVVYEQAPRGRILDRNGKVLVDNRGSQTITVDRNQVKDKPEVVGRLAALLNIPLAELRKRMADVRFSPYTPVPVADEVPEETIVYLREHQDEFPGVAAPTRPERAYPNGSLAAHLLGYVGQTTKEELDARRSQGYREGDEIGKQGVERAYEQDLRGIPGSKRLQVNSAGKVLGPPLQESSPQQGRDLFLTIDLDVQTVAENALAQGLDATRHVYDKASKKDFAAPAGSVVVLDPRDGSIVAMASNPTFDPGQFVNGIKPDVFRALTDPAAHFPLNNRATQGLYSAGSTFKLVTSIAAVEAGLIDARTTVLDGGSFRLNKCKGEKCIFRNAGGVAHGRVNLTRALTVSSDVFYYQLGAQFWNLRSQHGDAMQDVARRLGLGQKTQIPLSPEAAGRVPDPTTRRRLHDQNPAAFPNGDWRTGDNINLAIGQGEMAVTPLQLATAYATFANGGSVWEPRVVDKVVDQQRRIHRQVEPVKLRTVSIPPVVRDPILAGLTGVIASGEGTAHSAFAGFPLNRMTVAGKTGTAQVAKKQDTALFVAFAPADNPQYVVAVVMEESGFGGSVAAPVARRILEKLAGGTDTGAAVVGGTE